MIINRKTQLLACVVAMAFATPVQLAFSQDRWDHDHDDHHHDHDNAGAAIAAGIIGLAIGAAIADSGDKHHQDDYAPPPPPAYPPNPYYAPPYRMSQGVVCYPAQRACYLPDGAFAALTTHSQFGN